LHYRRNLNFQSGFNDFRNLSASQWNTVQYRMNLGSGAVVLDVTDPLNAKIQSFYNDGGNQVFKVNNYTAVNEYAVLNGSAPSPELLEKIDNQNIHATGVVQYIVIAAPEMLEAAEKIANWHKTRDNLDVKVVTPQQI